MIVPMQKVTLFISAAYKEKALEKLRSLGVVHVRHLQTPVSEGLTQLESELERVERCLGIFAEISAKAPRKGAASPALIEKVLSLDAERKQLLGKIEEKQTLLDWFALWGKVSLSDIEELRTRGIFLRLYRTNRAALANLPDEYHVKVLEDDKGQLRVALLGQSEEQRLDVKEELVPTVTFEKVETDSVEIRKRLQEIDKELAVLASRSEDLLEYQSDLERRREFARVASGMQAAEEICYLQGYCPDPKMSSLTDAAEKEGWGLLSAEPDPDENPPTQLRMSRWSRIIKPVFEFLGTVPGYREFDISRYFLIFFSIFVAMIIGDAGYGAIFLLLSIFAHRKSAKQGKPISLAIQLFYVLSIGTVIWGTITGNWFGSVAIAGLPFFKAITIPQLATFPELFPELSVDPQQKVMLICFVIAIIHLGLANIINFINDFPQWKSFGHLGWFAIMAGLFLVVLKLVLGMNMPGFTIPLIAVGLLAVILFINQEKGISFFKGVAKGLGGAFTTFLDTISSFSNIISYIRLFAVGMATVAIASSFNQIAAPMMKGFTIPAAILVLLIGHSLNIVMGLLSVIVHGIRLNVLEFSSQLGMEWTGYEYDPFRDKSKEITEGE